VSHLEKLVNKAGAMVWQLMWAVQQENLEKWNDSEKLTSGEEGLYWLRRRRIAWCR